MATQDAARRLASLPAEPENRWNSSEADGENGAGAPVACAGTQPSKLATQGGPRGQKRWADQALASRQDEDERGSRDGREGSHSAVEVCCVETLGRGRAAPQGRPEAIE